MDYGGHPQYYLLYSNTKLNGVINQEIYSITKDKKMDSRKKISKKKVISVLILTIIIFSLGIFIGNNNTNNKLSKVVDLNEDLQLQTASIEVEYDILKDNLCLDNNPLFLTEELFELSRKVEFMENTLGYDNSKIKQLKEKYFILEAKHWLLAKKRINTCFNQTISLNNTIILYFYSNKGDCPNCAQQGTVITYLHNIYNNMKVYSFDIKSNSPAIRTIKKIYKIDEKKVPTLIINDEVHQGYLNADDLIGFINTQLKERKTNQENKKSKNTTIKS